MNNVTENNQALIFQFPARMDTYKSQEMENDLTSQISSSSKKIVFDLEGVMYISSYFLRLCLSTLKSVGNERFAIKNVRTDLRKVFAVAGFDQQMNIE